MRRVSAHVFRTGPLSGYGPLLAGSAAFVLMLVAVPSQSPSPQAVAGPGPVTENQVATGADTVVPCTERSAQISDDPYAPPCFTWTGTDNGGETSRGVTADTITVSYRNSNDVADMAAGMRSELPEGAGRPDLSADAMTNTVKGLVDYFNEHFQFYGRKIKVVSFDATGAPMQELTGAG
jgi:hypothetical protein